MKKILTKQTKPFERKNVDTFRIFIYRILPISRTQIVFCLSTDYEYSNVEYEARRYEHLVLSEIADGLYRVEKLKNVLNYKIVLILYAWRNRQKIQLEKLPLV